MLQMHPTSSILWGRAAAGSKVTVYFNGKGYIAKTKPGKQTDLAFVVISKAKQNPSYVYTYMENEPIN